MDAPPLENSPACTLIMDTAWLGDVVFTTSLIAAARKAWPKTELHVLVAPRGEPLVRDQAAIDNVWVYDKSGREKSLMSLFALGRRLRETKFDVVLNAHPSARSRWLTRLTRAPIRVGYKGFGARLCFTHVIPNDLGIEPDHVLRRIALLRALDIPAVAEPLHFDVPDEAKNWADDFLKGYELPLLGIICGSARPTKRWNDESFAEIGKRWASERRGTVVVFAGRAEESSARTICAHIGDRAVPIIQESIPHVAALLARCEAVIGNDTGISFLAIAAGCPRVLVLYGSTQVNYAFPPPHRAITAGVPCCLSRTGHGAAKCRWTDQPWCMQQISVERVWGELHY